MSDLPDKKTLEEAIGEYINEHFKCYFCEKPTDRYITFNTVAGIIEAFECLDCRQLRVQAQVDAGLRPASDLNPENLPERKTRPTHGYGQ
jgi:hypothetical protein